MKWLANYLYTPHTCFFDMLKKVFLREIMGPLFESEVRLWNIHSYSSIKKINKKSILLLDIPEMSMDIPLHNYLIIIIIMLTL